jgi:hypothetical protein
MKKCLPLVVAGIVFTLVAICHLLRIMYHWQATIAGHNIPMSVSLIGLIVTAILALWMFAAAAKK